MKRGIFQTLKWILFLLVFTQNIFSQSEDFKTTKILSQKTDLSSNKDTKINNIEAINFKQKGEVSEVEIVLDTNEATAKKFNVLEDKQIILDIKGAKATERVMRAFDTSEFSGSVVFVSAYKKSDTNDGIRLAIQLRDNVRSILKRKNKRIILEIENRFGVFDQNDMSTAKNSEEKVATNKTSSAGKYLVPKSKTVEDILENLTLSGRKKYIGDKISINVKNTSVEDLLRMVAEASGFNIIITEEIKDLKPLSLNLTNVPWDQALDTLLGLNKLVAKKNGIILMIQTLESVTTDREAEAKARLLTLKQEPLVTKVFPISYAQTKQMITILKEYLSPKRGRINQDIRTNLIIIKDTPNVIEKIRKIIDVLDAQTPQVLIESRIVEVSESYSKSLGLQNGFGFSYDPVGAAAGTAANLGQPGTSGSENFGPGFSFNSAGGQIGGTSNFGVMQLGVGQFGRILDLDFRLQLLETEAKGKIISSPKVVTQNKQKAVLKSTRTEAYLVVSGSGNTATTGSDTAQAQLVLSVTPQITNEGSISMAITVKKEDFAERVDVRLAPNKTGNEIKTNVLVDNGATIVIGGVYEYNKRQTISGIPYLKDIPLLGWLFRNQYQPTTSKREIIIFITPRIINQEEAGIVGRS